MSIKKKIYTIGAITFFIFIILAFMNIWTHRQVLSNLQFRDEVNEKLSNVEAFIEWKNELVRTTSDIIASGHVPLFTEEQFNPPPNSPKKESEFLIASGKKLIGLIASEERLSSETEEKFGKLRLKINELYFQLDEKIATVLAIAQMDQVLEMESDDRSSLAPYVLKSLNQLTLIALNSLISRKYTDEAKGIVTKNEKFLKSQLKMIDEDGSISVLFDQLFAQIKILDISIRNSNQKLERVEIQIAEAKETFNKAVESTHLQYIVDDAYLRVEQANETLENASRRTLIMVVIFLFLVPIIVIVVGIFGLNSTVIKPITHLVDAMKNVEKGRFDIRIPLKSNDEIGRLGQAYNAMASEIKAKVTEMSELNQILSESESKYKTLVNNIPQRIYLKDKNLFYVSCNRNYAKDVNIKMKDIVGKTDFDFFPSELAEKYRNDDKRILRRETSEEMEELYQNNGKKMFIQTVKTPVWDDAGEIHGILGIFWDITERKQAEMTIKQSRERLNLIFNSVQAGILIIDKNEFIITDANQAAVEMIGTSREKLIGSVCYKHIFSNEDWECPAKNENFLKDSFEHLLVTNEGKKIPIMKTVLPLEIDDKEYFLESFIDISKLKEAECEKQHLEKQLRQAQKLESIGRLAGGVAHDLNNLLSPILGYSEMLLEDKVVPAPDDESVEQIYKAGVRARDIVRQLLAFSRRQTLEYQVLQLNKIIEDFKTLLRRTIREDIEIKIIKSKEPGLIKADIGQIEQVIMNLVVNAADAMSGAGLLTIETSQAELDENYILVHPNVKPGTYVVLSVTDTGCGMDQKTQAQIFEPFFSTKGELGTGLGLATVYGIVKQHGGNIWVYSEPGKGTTFKVYLPLANEVHKEKKSVKVVTSKHAGFETVLLAEDNEQVRKLASSILQRRGFNVLLAQDGSEALKIIDSHEGPLHILLTDVIMPDINGKELFNKIAQKYPNTRVLYMSGYTNDTIANHGVLDKGVKFIQKPFTAQALVAKVRETIDQ